MSVPRAASRSVFRSHTPRPPERPASFPNGYIVPVVSEISRDEALFHHQQTGHHYPIVRGPNLPGHLSSQDLVTVRLDRPLGNGKGSIVVRGRVFDRNQPTHQLVAIKASRKEVMDGRRITREEHEDRKINEYESLKILNENQHFPKAYFLTLSNIQNSPSPLALVMEYIPGKTGKGLALALKQCLQQGQLSLRQFWGIQQFVSRSLLRALQGLEDARLIHGDIKPDNLKIRASANGDVRVILMDLESAMRSRIAAPTRVEAHYNNALDNDLERTGQLRTRANVHSSGRTLKSMVEVGLGRRYRGNAFSFKDFFKATQLPPERRPNASDFFKPHTAGSRFHIPRMTSHPNAPFAEHPFIMMTRGETDDAKRTIRALS